MKSIILFLIFFVISSSSAFGQKKIIAKEIKQIEHTELENIDCTVNYYNVSLNQSNSIPVHVFLRCDDGGRYNYSIEFIKEEYNTNNRRAPYVNNSLNVITFYYPFSMADIMLNQLDKGNCKVYYNFNRNEGYLKCFPMN